MIGNRIRDFARRLNRSVQANGAAAIRTAVIWAAVLGAAASGALAAGPPAIEVPDADAATEAQMKPYVERIEHTDEKFEMLPIRGGRFTMGSPDGEAGRKPDESPRHEVEVSPFWMAKCEIPWDVYEVWMADLDIVRRQVNNLPFTERDKSSEPFQISKPTKPYTDMSFGMGKRGFPAISMTQHAARVFCQWLSAKTGRYYRLPTEAEWEYACRAGTTTAYSFGDDPKQLGDYAWFVDNSDEKYQKVGKKKPNPWGLHDMHGNVAEWVLDQHTLDFYGQQLGQGGGRPVKDPLAIPLKEYERVVRGGSWDAEPAQARSAARLASHLDWKQQDPQLPQSIWYLTDAQHVGFRVVRPLVEPTDAEKAGKWDKSEPPQVDRKEKTNEP